MVWFKVYKFKKVQNMIKDPSRDRRSKIPLLREQRKDTPKKSVNSKQEFVQGEEVSSISEESSKESSKQSSKRSSEQSSEQSSKRLNEREELEIKLSKYATREDILILSEDTKKEILNLNQMMMMMMKKSEERDSRNEEKMITMLKAINEQKLEKETKAMKLFK